MIAAILIAIIVCLMIASWSKKIFKLCLNEEDIIIISKSPGRSKGHTEINCEVDYHVVMTATYVYLLKKKSRMVTEGYV